MKIRTKNYYQKISPINIYNLIFNFEGTTSMKLNQTCANYFEDIKGSYCTQGGSAVTLTASGAIATTDAGGNYSFADVCPGTYRIGYTTIKPVGGINS